MSQRPRAAHYVPSLPREKNFIRSPSPAELAKLRTAVRQVACSQCGAPIDLVDRDRVHALRRPVALIDPEGVANALRELAAGTLTPAAVDPQSVRRQLSVAQIDAIFDLARMRESKGNDDLASIGATAIGALIAGLIASR
jgi:hypothetical protein